MAKTQCNLAIPGELILSFSRLDDAARGLIEELRGTQVGNITHVQSLEEKLQEAHVEPAAEPTLEFHLVRVPEGEEQWAITHLQFLYARTFRQLSPYLSQEFLSLYLDRPNYNFTVVPNGVLSLPGGGRGPANVRAADFVFDPFHTTYKSMLGLSGAPPNLDRVSVAILDSGIADDVLSDPNLFRTFNISQMVNFVGPKSQAATDEYGHGTVIAHILNDVAPGVQLSVYKVADANGRATEWDTIAAVAACGGADVVNMSLQFGLNDRSCGRCGHQSRSSRSAAFSNMMGEIQRSPHEPVFVASAGNAAPSASPDTELAFPSRFASVLAVGAVDSRWKLSSVSYYGNKDHDGNLHENHYVMPGGEPSSTPVESVGSFGVGTKPYYGTSFAAAYASAVVTRLIARQGIYGTIQTYRVLPTLRGKADTTPHRRRTTRPRLLRVRREAHRVPLSRFPYSVF